MRPSASFCSSRRLAGSASILILVLIGGWWFSRDHPSANSTADPFAVAPLSSSPFLNVGPEAQLVGSDACRDCHPAAFASYRRTGMGRSMSKVTLDQAPPNAVFDHPVSGRRYHVIRHNGQLWHRELLVTPGAADVVLGEYPIHWVIGSGRHWQSYLTEVDGFLVESPLSWYPRQPGWGMSPGYDIRDQMGFARGVGEGCLICHGGRSEAIDGSLHRMRIHERRSAAGVPVPGRCTWSVDTPGGAAAAPLNAIDCTIVNPAYLSASLGRDLRAVPLNSDAAHGQQVAGRFPSACRCRISASIISFRSRI